MFFISLGEESGRMGMATRPKAVAVKNATVQLGMLAESMATRSPALMPKRESLWL